MTDMDRKAPQDRLDAALGALPDEVPPGRDLWPGIEARLSPAAGGDVRGVASRRWGWQVAAAVALVAVSSLVTATLVRRHEVASLAVAPGMEPGPAGVSARPASFGPSHRLNPEYEQARRQLTALLQQRIDRMPASARSKLQDNLAQLRRAASEINDALAEQPGDPLLEELLLGTYQEELAVLAAANQLAAAGGAGPTTDSTRMQL
jgi:hypothetical protein